jgi:hypothetical protein
MYMKPPNLRDLTSASHEPRATSKRCAMSDALLSAPAPDATPPPAALPPTGPGAEADDPEPPRATSDKAPEALNNDAQQPGEQVDIDAYKRPAKKPRAEPTEPEPAALETTDPVRTCSLCGTRPADPFACCLAACSAAGRRSSSNLLQATEDEAGAIGAVVEMLCEETALADPAPPARPPTPAVGITELFVDSHANLEAADLGRARDAATPSPTPTVGEPAVPRITAASPPPAPPPTPLVSVVLRVTVPPRLVADGVPVAPLEEAQSEAAEAALARPPIMVIEDGLGTVTSGPNTLTSLPPAPPGRAAHVAPAPEVKVEKKAKTAAPPSAPKFGKFDHVRAKFAHSGEDSTIHQRGAAYPVRVFSHKTWNNKGKWYDATVTGVLGKVKGAGGRWVQTYEVTYDSDEGGEIESGILETHMRLAWDTEKMD